MKKSFLRIAVFLFMFALGLSLYIGWKYFIVPVQVNIEEDLTFETAPVKTTVCEIENYSNSFDGRLVSFKATVYAYDSDLVLYPLECTPDHLNSYLPPAIRINNGFIGNNNNLLTILQTSQGAHDSQIKEVDINVIGIVKEHYDKDGKKLFSVIPKQIQIISSFRQFEPKGMA